MTWKTLLAGAAFVGAFGIAPAQAQVVGCDQNDAFCMVDDGPNSPLIAKYTIDDGDFIFEMNPPQGIIEVFDAFTFTNTMAKPDEPEELISGDWEFDPTGTPYAGVVYVSAKCGTNINIITTLGGATSGQWSCGNVQQSLSSLMFFDTENGDPTPDPMPEPMSMALLGLGLAGLGWMTRKRA